MNNKKYTDMRAPFRALAGVLPDEAFGGMKTPCYIIDEGQLHENGKILRSVIENTGCSILLAQKAFSNYDFYPLLSQYLSGTEASGLFEARLGAEEMPGKEVHVFCAAYTDEEIAELLEYADHVIFNSVSQLRRFGAAVREKGCSTGLRINPECSTQDGHEIYDPCAPGSRLGVTRAVWDDEMTAELLELLDGLHFHTLCEQDSDALEVTVKSVEEKFGDVLPSMKWLNMGGGHHITRDDYDVERLERIICSVRDKWKLKVYLEPGEAAALNAGFLACRVLDVVKNGPHSIAILDVSAACHMPDVIEMPYMPPLYGAQPADDCAENEEGCAQDVAAPGGSAAAEGECADAEGGCTAAENDCAASKAGETACFTYRLAGPTCLAGDVTGDYIFSEELRTGDILLFGDMAIYSTCKNNTFNGMPLPDIWKRKTDGTLERLTSFGYEDFKMRLGRK